MKYCGNCGHPAEDHMKFCPECGAAMPVFGQTQSRQHTAPKVIYCGSCGMRMAEGTRNCPMCGAPVEGAGRTGKNRRQNFDQKPPKTSDIPQKTEANKPLAIISYLGILVFIPLLIGRKSQFVRFHTNQGLILTIIRFFTMALHLSLGEIRLPFVGSLYGIINALLVAAMVMGILYAVQGRMQ